MAIIIDYPVPYAPVVEDSFSRIMKLLPIVDCPQLNTPPFIGDSQANGWNCNLCASDAPYHNLWKRGDIIPFQAYGVDQANADPKAPTIGFLDSASGVVAGTNYYVKLEVYDWDCVTLLFDQADAVCSDYWVGFSEKIGSIQTFFLDTSTLALAQEIFRVKITTYDSLGAVVSETWSEPFCLASCATPYTVLMQGFHPVEDCLQRQYITPDNALGGAGSQTPLTDYYTSWRFAGELINIGTTQERVLNDNDKVLSNKVRTNFQIAMRKIPPYTKEILSTIITSTTVLIDPDDGNGLQEYEEFTDIAKNIDNGTRMFLPRIECVQICEIDGFKCDD